MHITLLLMLGFPPSFRLQRSSRHWLLQGSILYHLSQYFSFPDKFQGANFRKSHGPKTTNIKVNYSSFSFPSIYAVALNSFMFIVVYFIAIFSLYCPVLRQAYSCSRFRRQVGILPQFDFRIFGAQDISNKFFFLPFLPILFLLLSTTFIFLTRPPTHFLVSLRLVA